VKNSEINKPVSFDPKNFSMSKAAVNHFKQSLSSMNSNLGIRFSVVETSGCSGYTYALDFVKKKQEEDKVFDCDNVKVFIDPKSFTFLKGTKVDFISEGVNAEIKFLNPNVKAVCGCGESFEVDI
tara:strand:+ start:224 stop:598 length:375 start_codon:yes stop_codon:yes gene_type:complete